MCPAFKSGDTVLVSKLPYFLNKPKIGDVIVLRKKKFIIKRIAKIDQNKIFVIGDNIKKSTDSRSFGWILKKESVGKVIFKF